MKIQLIAVILSALILAGCSNASPAAESSGSSSCESSVSVSEATPAPSPDKPESAATSASEPSAAPKPSATPKPMPSSAPSSSVQPVEEASPAPESTVQADNTTAPSEAVATGAIPFSVAEGTDKWWYIDSTDSAYWAVQDGINAIRASVGLGALEMDDGLSTTASSRCESFVAGGPFDHSGMVTASEICARGPIGSAAAVCEAWKNSPDHYANIVSDQFTKMGVGCWFCSTDQGQYTYWVVTFE